MPKGIRKVLIDIFNLFYKVIYGYARWVLAAVIVIIYAQVLCRNILRINIHWNQEVMLLFTIWITFLGIAVGAEKNLYIGVELFCDKFPVKIRNVMGVLDRIITLLIGAFSAVYGVRMVPPTMDSRLPVIKRPSSLMYITIPVSDIAIIYFMVPDTMGLKGYKKIDDVGKFNRGEEEEE